MLILRLGQYALFLNLALMQGLPAFASSREDHGGVSNQASRPAAEIAHDRYLALRKEAQHPTQLQKLGLKAKHLAIIKRLEEQGHLLVITQNNRYAFHSPDGTFNVYFFPFISAGRDFSVIERRLPLSEVPHAIELVDELEESFFDLLPYSSYVEVSNDEIPGFHWSYGFVSQTGAPAQVRGNLPAQELHDWLQVETAFHRLADHLGDLDIGIQTVGTEFKEHRFVISVAGNPEYFWTSEMNAVGEVVDRVLNSEDPLPSGCRTLLRHR